MTVVKAKQISAPAIDTVPQISGAEIASAYSAYLADESRLTGTADRIFFPHDMAQVAAVVKWANEKGIPLTVSGARTGITGGAVPHGGALLSCEKLTAHHPVREENGRFLLKAGVGVTIQQIADALHRRAIPGLPQTPLFYPPDPTETTAELGGTIACNASGARTFRYGPTRNHVNAVTVVLPTGEVLDIKRGDASFDAKGEITIAGSRSVTLKLPEMPNVAVRKNVAGFYAKPGMDLVDLFIGSEGILGVVTEAELVLMPEPAGRVAALLFTADETSAVELVKSLRGEKGGFPIKAEAIEFFDRRSLDLLYRKREEEGPGSEIPKFPYPSGSAIFTEFPYTSDAEIDGILESLLGLIETAGIPEDKTWVGTSAEETAKMKAFRHALPETVNSIVGRRKKDIPGIHKVGTDLAVPDGALDAFLAAHYRIFDGFEFLVFGHIGDNHLHANVLPRNDDELARAKAAYKELVKEALALHGTVAAEHGIGKLKTGYLKMMLTPAALAGMKRIKDALDPKGILSPGNVFG
jgi:D-lactate dehydrogenase (cytochrome)